AWDLDADVVTTIDPPKSLDGLLDGIKTGKLYRFRLRANPTRRVHARAATEAGGESPRTHAEAPTAVGKRVELAREEDQVAWLRRKAEASGFKLCSAMLSQGES